MVKIKSDGEEDIKSKRSIGLLFHVELNSTL